jgi:hypothetical protein
MTRKSRVFLFVNVGALRDLREVCGVLGGVWGVGIVSTVSCLASDRWAMWMVEESGAARTMHHATCVAVYEEDQLPQWRRALRMPDLFEMSQLKWTRSSLWEGCITLF